MSIANSPIIHPLPRIGIPVAGANRAGSSRRTTPAVPLRTVWGLDPIQLHTRYWASLGVQVVRQGEPSEIVKHAELFLLMDPESLTLFKLGPLMDVLNWVRPHVLFVRLHDARERGYRERAVTGESDQFVKFERLYDAAHRLTRVVLTPDRDVAQLWQSAPDPKHGWSRLRRFSRRTQRATQSIDSSVYDRNDPREVAWFVHDLVQCWKRPDSTVLRARPVPNPMSSVWRDAQAKVLPGVKFIGPVWVGSGRTVDSNSTVVGPVVIWDDPLRRPVNDAIQWLEIEPTEAPAEPSPWGRDEEVYAVKPSTIIDRTLKRGFDIVCALIGLMLTVPLYPLVMLAILLEDGRPFFFGHVRETLGARPFTCWKFRSMRKDAEKMKAELQLLNQADGPQFYIENDPRLTRVGKLLRRYNFDEFPQFWNVLVGDMSIVGPRPSPHKENQYCPAWREARLSVRPGITGLWQVKRTRRAGTDFQEWIMFDLEYVERRSFWIDLMIIYKTFANVIGKLSRS